MKKKKMLSNKKPIKFGGIRADERAFEKEIKKIPKKYYR